ncbi:MAG: hypothetical protein JWM56_336 [Candidatus Peribacteria bacterium]|nr:hypothetical protein [Candidatus Peribacteria bacterium]
MDIRTTSFREDYDDEKEITSGVKNDMRIAHITGAFTKELLIRALMCSNIKRGSKIEGSKIIEFGKPDSMSPERVAKLQSAYEKIPAEKYDQIRADLQKIPYGDLIRNLLLDTGVLQPGIESATQQIGAKETMILHLKANIQSSHIIEGIMCLLQNEDTNLTAEHFPDRYNMDVLIAAAEHFKQVHDPGEFEELSKINLSWSIIASCMRLREGRIGTCLNTAPTDYDALPDDSIVCTPYDSTKYYYKNLAADTAFLFNCEPHENIPEIMSNIEAALLTADTPSTIRNFLNENMTAILPYTADENIRQAACEIDLLGREDAQLAAILYKFKKEMEDMATKILTIIQDNLTSHYNVQYPHSPTGFTQKDAENLRQFCHIITLISHQLRILMQENHSIHTGFEKYTALLLDHSVYISLLFTYLQEACPYFFVKNTIPLHAKSAALHTIKITLAELQKNSRQTDPGAQSTHVGNVIHAQTFHTTQAVDEIYSTLCVATAYDHSKPPLNIRRKPQEFPVPRPAISYNALETDADGKPPRVMMKITDSPLDTSFLLLNVHNQIKILMHLHRFDGDMTPSEFSVIPYAKLLPLDHDMLNTFADYAGIVDTGKKNCATGLISCFSEQELDFARTHHVDLRLVKVHDGHMHIYGFVLAGKQAPAMAEMCEATELPELFKKMRVSFPPEECARYMYWDTINDDSALPDKKKEQYPLYMKKAVMAYVNHKRLWPIHEACELLAHAGIKLCDEKGTHWEFEWEGHARPIPSAALKDKILRVSSILNYLFGTHDVKGIGNIMDLYEHIPEKFKKADLKETEDT